MKKVSLYIKNIFVWLLFYVCLYQCAILLLTENNSLETNMKEVWRLREDTKEIINVNYTYFNLYRNSPVKNADGEIISYKEEVIESIKIRLSTLNNEKNENMLNENIPINKKLYSLTATFDEDIREDDILKEGKRVYRVIEIESCYYGGKKTIDTCYKKTGRVEEIK